MEKKGDSPGQTSGLEEIKNCDFRLTPVDTNLTVVSFRISIYSNVQPVINAEAVSGDRIPDKYRDKIVNPNKKSVFLEYIKAVYKNGKNISLPAVAIRM